MLFDDWGHFDKPTIRPATPSDSAAIARIHVDCWRSAYKDILPEDVLKQVRRRDRERAWMRLIAGGDTGPYIYVSDHPTGGIVGFIAAGPERSDNPDYSAEVYALFVAEPYQRNGIGRSLVQYVAQVFLENAHKGLLAWNFSGSPGNGFFHHLGAQEVATRSRSFDGTSVEETAFGWPDIKRLLVEVQEQEEAAEQPSEPEQDESEAEDEQQSSEQEESE